MQDTTIAALATAAAPAGVAIIRVSGSEAKNALMRCFKAKQDPIKSPRTLIYGDFISASDGSIIDKVLAVYMPKPNSFTGEDCVEFHLHGNLLIVNNALNSLYQAGIKPAEAGEFTKRAFLNGKIDLIQAESVADLISATSESALRAAQDQLTGKLSVYIDNIAEPLRDILAQIEAHIDFPEEDINPDNKRSLINSIIECQNQIDNLIQSYSYGKKVKEGLKILIAGPPNAGKSSLLNTLLGQNRAIVTDIKGTTRDLIEADCIIDGHSFILCDSAGITETEDRVERIGIELAISHLSWADLILFVVDASDKNFHINDFNFILDDHQDKCWVIYNKCDLVENVNHAHDFNGFCISTFNNCGIEDLKLALVKKTMSFKGFSGEVSSILTNSRHHQAAITALKFVEKSRTLLEQDAPLEVISIELRSALLALEEMVGKTYSDEILGRIFSRFCIGK